METKEYQFNGVVLNGFLMLFVNLAVLVLSIYWIVCSIIMLDEWETFEELRGEKNCKHDPFALYLMQRQHKIYYIHIEHL